VGDVVAEELRSLVPVRRTAGGVEQRDVVRVGELLGGSAGELAEADREHGGAQGVLERLSGTEIGSDGERGHHFGQSDRLRGLTRAVHACRGLRGLHGAILTGQTTRSAPLHLQIIRDWGA
jgi:hypothetical protein